MVVPAQRVRSSAKLRIKIHSGFSLTDQLEMTLFVLRYCCCLLMFLLGLKAPGIMQNVDYFSLNDPGRRVNTQVGLEMYRNWGILHSKFVFVLLKRNNTVLVVLNPLTNKLFSFLSGINIKQWGTYKFYVTAEW